MQNKGGEQREKSGAEIEIEIFKVDFWDARRNFVICAFQNAQRAALFGIQNNKKKWNSIRGPKLNFAFSVFLSKKAGTSLDAGPSAQRVPVRPGAWGESPGGYGG